MILQPTTSRRFNNLEKRVISDCIDRAVGALFDARGATAAIDSQVVRGITQQNILNAQHEIHALRDYLIPLLS